MNNWPCTDAPLRLWRAGRLLLDILRLPRVRLHFHAALNPGLVHATYRLYTQRHPRYPLFRHKTLGIALIPLCDFKSGDAYLATLRRKDLGGYHNRKALARGYVFGAIDRNEFIDDIHVINTSQPIRQGRPMDAGYSDKQLHYEDVPSFRYYGVQAADGRLVAYCNVGIYGDFAATDRLLSDRNSNGAMYLLLTEIVCQLIAEGRLRYLMYDTYLGAQPGLREFKRKLGFRPYRVHYRLEPA
jgi:hypothetical protein